MGAGLSVLTGIRAFLPVAFLALYSRLEFASSPVLNDTFFGFLEKTWVLVLLFALAIIEMVVVKLFAVSPLRDQITQPIRIFLGGVVFAAAVAPEGWIAMVVSGVLGLVIAGLADHVLRSTRKGTSATKTARPPATKAPTIGMKPPRKVMTISTAAAVVTTAVWLTIAERVFG